MTRKNDGADRRQGSCLCFGSCESRWRKVLRQLTVLMIIAALGSGCAPQSITMELEEMPLGPANQEVIQAMEEYQAAALETYRYRAFGPWMTVNRTACIRGTQNNEIVVFTRDDEERMEWRTVQYIYPFYESRLVSEGSATEEDPLVVAPLIVSPDGLAVAYQSLRAQGRFLEIAEVGKPTVMVGGDGQVYSTDPSLMEKEESSWELVKAGWSSDGRYLLFYHTGDWSIGVTDDAEIDLEIDVEDPTQSGADGDRDSSREDKGVVLTLKDIYGYDRQTCQVKQIWEAMRLNLPTDKKPDPEIVADANEDNAAMFLLFDEKADCPDVKLWNQNGMLEVSLVSLPENPCIQMDLQHGVYYYQESGDIWKAPLGKMGQSQRILSAGQQLQAFLISADERRIFTIETREETEDVYLYLQDDKGSWYKQAIAVDTKGACSLQLSDDQRRLLVECQTGTENQALIIYFNETGSPEAGGLTGE